MKYFKNGKAMKETNLNQLIDYEGFSDRQKNIIVKYYELITNSKKISYWKTPNELNKVSSITANIKLHNYFLGNALLEHFLKNLTLLLLLPYS